MNVEEFRKAGYAAIDAICDYYSSLDTRPVKAKVQPGYLIETLPSEAPERGEAFELVAQDFRSLILPGITHWQHPQFFAYFPSISTFESILGELYTASVSNPGFNWLCSPACTELEQVVLDWMAKMLGLSSTFYTSSGIGGGIIMGSASESCLTAAIAARERALNRLYQQQGDLQVEGAGLPQTIRDRYAQKLVMYGSTQTHSLGAKAALLLGLTFRAVPVSASDAYALRGDALGDAIEKDVEAGLIPFFVGEELTSIKVATVGTTSTGAVDRIDEIGEITVAYPTIFVHVDAAWAGVAYALPEYRTELRLANVNQYADSFCTNAHKWGLTGFDCSLLYVRNRKDLTSALDITPAFLRTQEGDAGTVIDYRNWQIALGRRFRSLKLWFVLRGYGVHGFQQHLRKGIDQAERLSLIIQASAIFELVTPPSLALVVFRLILPKAPRDDAELNLLNQRLNTNLGARYDVMVTQTMLHSKERDVFCIRFAIGGVSTEMKDVETTWRIIESEGERVLEGWGKD